MAEVIQGNEAPQEEDKIKGIPVFADSNEPEIKDAAFQQASTVWHGAN